MNKTKKCKESLVIMTELVLPNDTNSLNNLMGGRMMHWMDIASAISAQRHSNKIVVTASVDNISFSQPIKIGDAVTIKSFVTRSFNSSMEVYLEVTSEDIPGSKIKRTNSAFFTFVAVGQTGNPIDVPSIEPETEIEKTLFEGALRRRQLRLVLSKRMDPKDATELKSIFFE